MTMIHRVCIAPMMNCTDRHDRYFLRLIAPSVLLYTEMVTTGALIHGDRHRFLAYDPLEHPVALQVGGNNPKQLADCALFAEQYGYDEINLNVGCPSDRVQSGQFGACLMLQPELVAECVSAMMARVKIPVSVKCRIGVDDQDSYAELVNFIEKIAKVGCKIFIIHARKAWLTGLSPKENRDIPPLRYEIVHQLKNDFPDLTIIINGGIKTVAAAVEQLQFCDGVMIGREAYSNPYFLSQLEEKIFNNKNINTREVIIEKLIPYIEQQLKEKTKLSSITRHILGLFQGQPGARHWRRYISEYAHLPGARVDVLTSALAKLSAISPITGTGQDGSFHI